MTPTQAALNTTIADFTQLLATDIPFIVGIFTTMMLITYTMRLFRNSYKIDPYKPDKPTITLTDKASTPTATEPAPDPYLVLSAGPYCELCGTPTAKGTYHHCSWAEAGDMSIGIPERRCCECGSTHNLTRTKGSTQWYCDTCWIFIANRGKIGTAIGRTLTHRKPQ